MIPAERAHMRVAAATHPGMSGKNNEDRYSVSAFQLEDEKMENGTPVPVLLGVVSDGIGGHRAGEVAAEMAVETISRAVATGDARHPEAVLFEAVIEASEAIYEKSEEEDELRGMGATCACAWVIGDRLYTVTVGDSRIYLMRGERILQVSTDHTWVREALEQGTITPEEAHSHPNAHVIRRYLGSRNTVLPDLRLRLRPDESDELAEKNQGLRLKRGDLVLLCSDGLTDLVSDDEILAAFQVQSLQEAVDRLIALANERGGHDNITLIALQAPPQMKPVVAPPEETRRERACLSTSGLLVSGVVALGALLIFLGWTFSGWNGAGSTATPAFSGTLQPLPGVVTTATLTPPSLATATLQVSPSRTALPGATRRGPTSSPTALSGTPSPTSQPGLTRTSAP